MFEQDQDTDQWRQQNDLLDQERTALDCLIVIHKHGHEGTADTLAPLLGISKLWKKTKEQFNAHARTASVG